MTLDEFLRAQLDADEQVASAAFGETNISSHWKIGNDCVADEHDNMVVDAATSYPHLDQPILAYVAAWDPVRVLAEVKAKRAILDLHKPYVSPPKSYGIPRSVVQCDHCMDLCHSRSGLACDSPDAPYPCPTVSILAQPYAGRDGWQDEWGIG